MAVITEVPASEDEMLQEIDATGANVSVKTTKSSGFGSFSNFCAAKDELKKQGKPDTFENMVEATKNLNPVTRQALIEERRARIFRKKKQAGRVKLDTVSQKKDAGNLAFKNGDFEMAIIWYTKALNALGEGKTYSGQLSDSIQLANLARESSAKDDDGEAEKEACAVEKEVDAMLGKKDEKEEQPTTLEMLNEVENNEQNTAEKSSPTDSVGASSNSTSTTRASDGTRVYPNKEDLERDRKALLHLVYANRSAAHCNLGEHYDALRDAKRAIHHKPNYIKAYARQALALVQLGRLKEAQDAYVQGLQRDPDNEALREGLQDVTTILRRKNDLLADEGAYGLFRSRSLKKYIALLINPLQLALFNWVLYCMIMVSIIGGSIFWVHGDKLFTSLGNTKKSKIKTTSTSNGRIAQTRGKTTISTTDVPTVELDDDNNLFQAEL